jgi:uroporphyrinogen-III synthase
MTSNKIFLNKVVAITRGERNNSEFIRKVKQEGGIPLSLPTIKLIPIDAHNFRKKFFDISSKKHEFYMFMSPNAVEMFLKMVKENSLSSVLQEQLMKSKVIAIGPSTKRILESNNIQVSWMPEDYSSSGLLKLMRKLSPSPGTRIFSPRSSASSSFMKDNLNLLGIFLDEFHIYYPQTETVDEIWVDFSKRISNKRIDVIIFTSPSAVRYFFSIMQQTLSNFRECLHNIEAIISIGPNTSKELISRNVHSIESKEHTINGTLLLAKKILSEN